MKGRDFVVVTKEVPWGTSAIEVLKDQIGIKEALFAQVKDTETKQEVMIDTDGIEQSGGEEGWRIIDLGRPLEADCQIEMADFNATKSSFWHSSAHILGSALESIYPDALLTTGPPTKDGFFYDFHSPSSLVVHDSDYPLLDAHIKTLIKSKLRFERLVITKSEALDLFAYNKFKSFLIETKIPDNQMTSVYKIGDFVDLCTGPHVQHTGVVKAFAINKHSAAYWLGEKEREGLQRVYGVAFPQKEQMEEYMRIKEEALKRDHRVIG